MQPKNEQHKRGHCNDFVCLESSSLGVLKRSVREKYVFLSNVVDMSHFSSLSIRFSDLVRCEEELLNVQRDLDDQKEECYGHMKVIQELKVAKRNSSSSSSSKSGVRNVGVQIECFLLCMRGNLTFSQLNFSEGPSMSSFVCFNLYLS